MRRAHTTPAISRHKRRSISKLRCSACRSEGSRSRFVQQPETAFAHTRDRGQNVVLGLGVPGRRVADSRPENIFDENRSLMG